MVLGPAGADEELRRYIAGQPQAAQTDLRRLAELVTERSKAFQEAQRLKQRTLSALSIQDFDPWLVAHYGQEFAIASGLSRSATSSAGNVYGRLAGDLARWRYGTPSVLLGSSLNELAEAEKQCHLAHWENEARRTPSDTFVLSRVSKERSHQIADELIEAVKAGRYRIGTPAFRAAFKAGIKELEEAPRGDVWATKMDVAVPGTEVGFSELKTGAKLDSSKAPADLKRLAQVALAYGDPDAALNMGIVGTLGTAIPSGIQRYFALPGPARDCQVLVGDAWWGLVLPEGVTPDQFWTIVAIVGKHYDCRPKLLTP